MADRDIANIGLRVIKRCGMYAEEYKAWITRESERPRIVETFDTFKMFWAAKITIVNQKRYLLACTALAWPQSTTMTPLCCTASQSQTSARHTPPLPSPSSPTA